jgi:hypothetical protein
MRDRIVELSPLLLVGVVLLAFQFTRGSSPAWLFHPLAEVTPTPVEVAGVVAQTAARRPTNPNVQPGSCDSAQPQFTGGIAKLKVALGSHMGEPVECERATSPQGDTQQKTTIGLAYYRKVLNVACFTTGWDHWALVNGALVHWTGEAVDPPTDASIVAQ